MKLIPLLALSLAPLRRHFLLWWYQYQENHALICAEVEAKREAEHRRNVAYYQKRAVMYSSRKNNL